jgi:hypothetical protein
MQPVGDAAHTQGTCVVCMYVCICVCISVYVCMYISATSRRRCAQGEYPTIKYPIIYVYVYICM